ncbi:MAG: isoprenylcysteine carboxylmethyltransferase family protein [Desulfobacteraceae bacterium]|nr:isoprenylcysteine carboxylmethyltransferase family protein [Desulfobacteraceae bacterium]
MTAVKKIIKTWWAWFDGLVFFHPTRWPHGEALSRICAMIIIGAFIARRVYQFKEFPQTFQWSAHFYSNITNALGHKIYSGPEIIAIWSLKLALWSVETAIFLGYIASYLSRSTAVAKAKGFMETAFPIIIAGLPVLMSLAPLNLPRWTPVSNPSHLYVYIAIMALMVTGGAINLVGLLTLRRAFTIMTEARQLITIGIFRHVRHPLYSSHFVMFLGSLFLRLQPLTIFLYIAFVSGQIYRSCIEERKMTQAFPQYQVYKQQTGMFFPRIGAFRRR